MSPLNCMSGDQFARIVRFQNPAGSVAAIINRKWQKVSGSRNVVPRLQQPGSQMCIGFGHSFIFSNMTTGHPKLDELAKGRELTEFVISILPISYLSLIEEVIRFEHAAITLKGEGFADITLQDIAVKVTPEGDITFPPFS